MIVLGISQLPRLFSITHDSAAALIINGEIVAAAEEERFNRLKHTRGEAVGATRYCLNAAGISLGDVDAISVANNPYALFANLRHDFPPKSIAKNAIILAGSEYCRHQLHSKTAAPVNYVNHHLAHASSGYYLSGFEEANILTIDGAGESETFTFFVGRGDKIRRIWNMPLKWHSSGLIGWAYSRLTRELALGQFGEGKTMGLASYGKSTFDLSQIFSIRGHRDYTFSHRRIGECYRKLKRTSSDQPFTQEQMDLAASVQKALETGVINLAREAYQKSGIRKFVLAGGVALNCNLNSRLLNEDFCEQLFVPPVANDSGLALGAALYHSRNHDRIMSRTRLKSPYLGPEFNDQQILSLLKRAKLTWIRHPDIEDQTAKAICSSQIVGWFQGRMEIGPRALGNRSILADATVPGMNDRVNLEVKKRENWRPFGPAVTQESAARYFHGFEKMAESPYMLHTVSVRDAFRATFPAIVHVDGSTRPQTVREDQNPRFYALLKAVEKIAGHPLVLNTSFNSDGEPIVCTPEDALRCFFTSALDLLVIGNFMIHKRI